VLLAGSVAYLEAVFAQHVTFGSAMALTAATVFLLAIVVVLSGPERRGAIFHDRDSYVRDGREEGATYDGR
jgi:hypothetical protein